MSRRTAWIASLVLSATVHVLALVVLQHGLSRGDQGSAKTKVRESVRLVEKVQWPELQRESAGRPTNSGHPEAWQDLGFPVAGGRLNPGHETAQHTRTEQHSMPPPPGPTPAEWALAAKYTLKNSKAYRYAWALQVRSMMGTAVEGENQGAVRFRFEISPDGALLSLTTLWSTSREVEVMARRAMAAMPPTPPTPTGKVLVFEKTLVFSPFTSEMPPSYTDDCKPDAPTFRNPFAWDGQSPQTVESSPGPAPMSQEEMETCRNELPPGTVDGEAGRDQRELDRWDSPRLGAR